MSDRAILDCPECGAPLVPAHGRGVHDSDGDFSEHGEGCGCPYCDWVWFDGREPVTCACGALVGIEIDDDRAYTVTLPAPPRGGA